MNAEEAARRILAYYDDATDTLQMKPKDDLIVAEAYLSLVGCVPSVSEGSTTSTGCDVGSAEREKRLRARLFEAIDYVEDAVRQWPIGSEEHRVAIAIHIRCNAALTESAS